jgi:hypothetical protein
MNPVNKALWFIESHFAEPAGLDEHCEHRQHLERDLE